MAAPRTKLNERDKRLLGLLRGKEAHLVGAVNEAIAQGRTTAEMRNILCGEMERANRRHDPGQYLKLYELTGLEFEQ